MSYKWYLQVLCFEVKSVTSDTAEAMNDNFMYVLVLTYTLHNCAILILHIVYFRLLTEEDEVRIYHSLENTRLYHEIEPTFIQISSEVYTCITKGKTIVLVTNLFSHHFFFDSRSLTRLRCWKLFVFSNTCLSDYQTYEEKSSACTILVCVLKITWSLSLCYFNLLHESKSLVC